jgi:hypothetical protein
MDTATDPQAEARRLSTEIAGTVARLRRKVEEAQALIEESRRTREERQWDARRGGSLASPLIGSTVD